VSHDFVVAIDEGCLDPFLGKRSINGRGALEVLKRIVLEFGQRPSAFLAASPTAIQKLRNGAAKVKSFI